MFVFYASGAEGQRLDGLQNARTHSRRFGRLGATGNTAHVTLIDQSASIENYANEIVVFQTIKANG